MSIGPLSSQTVSTTRLGSDDGDSTQTASTTAPDASTTEAKPNVAQDVVDGARALFQGLGNDLKAKLDGVGSVEVAGGKRIRPCGRGGRCSAQLTPARGLGGPQDA